MKIVLPRLNGQKKVQANIFFAKPRKLNGQNFNNKGIYVDFIVKALINDQWIEVSWKDINVKNKVKAYNWARTLAISYAEKRGARIKRKIRRGLEDEIKKTYFYFTGIKK